MLLEGERKFWFLSIPSRNSLGGREGKRRERVGEKKGEERGGGKGGGGMKGEERKTRRGDETGKRKRRGAE